MEKNKDKRVRNWTFIVYPESAPADWVDKIRGMCIPAFISPLHDKDINADGTPKKPHHHVMLMFQGKKSFEQIVDIISYFNCPIPQAVNDARGMARYFCHLDNPEKYQYNPDDIICCGGSDYRALIGLASDKKKAVKEMINFCIEYNIYEFYQLVEYAMENNEEWFDVLNSSSFLIREYLRSRLGHLKDELYAQKEKESKPIGE